VLADLTPELTARAAELMRRYQDHPMDLADAKLVAMAEHRNDNLIFSLDAHFRSYQLRGRRHLRVIPG
jgi:predicted nucleic acid-binding protein